MTPESGLGSLFDPLSRCLDAESARRVVELQARAVHNIDTVGPFALSAVRDRLIFANGEITGNIWMFDLPATPDKK
jgi:hypothetical protein